MEIRNGVVSFHIAADDRPYIKFKRTLNRGTKKRAEKKNAKGEVTRAAHPGQFEEEWIKSLISHRAPFDPYTWCTPEWALRRVEVGCEVIGFGNMEKLPASYPAEWRAKLQKTIDVIAAMAKANARVMELEAKLEEKAEAKTNGESTPTDVRKEEGVERHPGQGAEKAPRAARQAANDARG